jgi:putative YphP/YqiW family bacilliredoxin
MALFQDGRPVYMLHRGEIERREPAEIARILTQVFDRFCVARQAV